MKLKHYNPNNKIVLECNLYTIELFILKNSENWI